jgi:hypothetical protein
MQHKPELRLVGGSAHPRGKPSPDARMRQLLRRRVWLIAEARGVEEELFAHRRRKADERGQIPPLSIDELIAENGSAK